jgi:pimeloyl-ACP methyl ester carboxylesterase
VLCLCFNLTFFWIPREVESGEEDSEGIRTVDHFVPHISTVLANEGERVELFVREKVRGHHRRNSPAVLMVHGATGPSVPAFDLQYKNYSWMDFLARAGFDVFAMDHTGYGLSPRPTMDDPCNASLAQQQSLLIPNPLPAPCPASYPFRLTTTQSDWDEINTVVDYILQFRGVDRVSLIGWSLGGLRMGGYAARHPEKVDKLFLYAPVYNRFHPSDPPSVLPQAGVPLQVPTIAASNNTWDSQVQCEDQFTPAIRDAIRSTILEFDPVGSTWGSEDLWRAPVLHSFWGWNTAFAQQVEAPTLIIVGDLDTETGVIVARNLYDDLRMDSKVFVHVACASHRLVRENRHMILLRASEKWLRHGTLKRASTLNAIQGPVDLRQPIRIFEREQQLSAPCSPHAASLISDAKGNIPTDACPESVRVLSSSLPLCVAKRSRCFASASMLMVRRTTLF